MLAEGNCDSRLPSVGVQHPDWSRGRKSVSNASPLNQYGAPGNRPLLRVKPAPASTELRGVGRTSMNAPTRCWRRFVSASATANRRLSGGQRQQRAPRRALVNQPKSPPARRAARRPRPQAAARRCKVELEAIQRRHRRHVRSFLTHDQGEALSMSNCVAVFSARPDIEQVEHVRAGIYHPPATPFVAAFVGVSLCSTARCRRCALLGVVGAHVVRPERRSCVLPRRSRRRAGAPTAPCTRPVHRCRAALYLELRYRACRVHLDDRPDHSPPACRATGSPAWPR